MINAQNRTTENSELLFEPLKKLNLRDLDFDNLKLQN